MYKEERWKMTRRKEARISARVLTIYKKASTTNMHNFLKHQPNVAENKYKHKEKFDAIQISSATCLDIQLWNLGIENKRSSWNRYSRQKKAKVNNKWLQTNNKK